jgi:hypothetical protein
VSENSTLQDVINRVKGGTEKLRAAGKRRDPSIEDESDLNETVSPTSYTDEHRSEQGAKPAEARPYEEPDLLDEVQEADSDKKKRKKKPAVKKLTGSQKALLCGVLVCVVFYGKSMLDSPSVPADEVTSSQTDPDAPTTTISGEIDDHVDGGFASSSGIDAAYGMDTDTNPPDDMHLDIPDQQSGLGTITDLGHSDSSALPDDDFAALAGGTSVPASAQHEPIQSTSSSEKPAFLADVAEAPFAQASAASSQTAETLTGKENQVIGTEASSTNVSPFTDTPPPPLGDGTLGGTENSVVDSSNPLPAAPTVDVQSEKLTALEGQLKAQSAKIAELEIALAKKTQPKPVSAAAPRQVSAKPVSQPRTRSIATQQSVRPKLCVKAVAQAARNCSTCVAHAFVVHNGAETMVGHGDKINEYRVAIVGDRLDLQGTAGTEPHKFWPATNGCAY